MRTTLILDGDLARLIQAEVERTGRPFEQIVNQAIRVGLQLAAPPGPRPLFRVRPHAFRCEPGIDLDRLNHLVDELEDGEYRRQHCRDA